MIKFIDFNELTKLTLQLALKIKESKQDFDFILSLERGGSFLARLLSDIFEKQILNMHLSSYKGIDKREDIKVASNIQEEFRTKIENKSLLVVDDVSDTGKTLKFATESLKDFKVKKFLTATFFYKPKTIFIPDFYVQKTDKWLVFPYEIFETYKSLNEKDLKLYMDFLKKQGLYEDFNKLKIALERKKA